MLAGQEKKSKQPDSMREPAECQGERAQLRVAQRYQSAVNSIPLRNLRSFAMERRCARCIE